MEMRRSFSLNSYGMLKPMAPYLRRSCMLLWKNARPKIILRQLTSLVHVSKNSESDNGSDMNVRSSPARRPLGASLVIFTEFSRMVMGKMGDGYAVSHSRKSLWTVGSLSLVSHTNSSSGMNDLARWQFWSTTQNPFSIPSLMFFMAKGPWPWPSDTASTRVLLLDSANLSMLAMGSEPAERTKTKGTSAAESSKHAAKSKGNGSMYLLPITSPT
mmetsp:Transcript_14313/g.34816  ORF Transcript_14313/g.34816 Transcript_14313/m.34816 type:complete len:215 (+) Transcript_14313:1442-2086(+)